MTPERFYDRVAAWFPPRVRAWLYGLAGAVCVGLVGVGLITEDVARAVEGVAGAALLGMALRNTPTD